MARYEPQTFKLTISMFNLPGELIYGIAHGGPVKTKLQTTAIHACLKASNAIMRIAMWVGFGVPPWQKLTRQSDEQIRLGDDTNQVDQLFEQSEEDESYSA